MFYGIIIVIVLMVALNLGLTLWMIKIMDFSLEGMGHLKIIPKGLKLQGKMLFMDNLITNSILSKLGIPLAIESSSSITLKSRNSNGDIDGYVNIGHSGFECLSDNFRVLNENEVFFSANSNAVYVGSDILKVKGDSGTQFKGSIQTTIVRAESGEDLKLESPTRRLKIGAPTGINIESRGGTVSTVALNDISFTTKGSINIRSSAIYMPYLTTARLTNSYLFKDYNFEKNKDYNVFQVCVCESGKIFLADPYTICSLGDLDIDIC